MNRSEPGGRIILTGDVHEIGNVSRDRHYASCSEIEAACEYAHIAKSFDLKITMFITGTTAIQSPNLLRRLASLPNVEIGGHTYNSLRPTSLHSLFQILTRSYYGPRIYQRWDIGRTLAILRKLAEAPVTTWRTHAYHGDGGTYG